MCILKYAMLYVLQLNTLEIMFQIVSFYLSLVSGFSDKAS